MYSWGLLSCFQYVKDTKKKANHNEFKNHVWVFSVVSNTSKILKRKQITTSSCTTASTSRCFQYVKDTKKKANHNGWRLWRAQPDVVSNTSKILKRKQITTIVTHGINLDSCFQYVKDTKKKANHNQTHTTWHPKCVVSNTSKILKRKQITTAFGSLNTCAALFPIRQRY